MTAHKIVLQWQNRLHLYGGKCHEDRGCTASSSQAHTNQQQLTESIIRDKQVEATAKSKENVLPFSSPAAKPTPTSGKKRKAEMSLDEEIAAYKADLDDVVSPDSFENDKLVSCSTIRTKMNKLFDSGIMSKAEFCRATGANSNSLNKFLKQKGPMGGSGSCVWYNAYAWFKQREVMGLKMPDPKKRQLEQQKKDDAAGGTPSKAPSSAAKTSKDLPDISEIYLQGEETDEVPVYDDCDEFRRKINAHMKTPGLTQAQFCCDLYAQLKAPKCKSIQPKQLTDFRVAKGSNTGAKSSVFYAAYVYFEKLRIAQGKPTTKHREHIFSIYPEGFPRDTDHRSNLYFVGAA
ncbi:uncharacterized protein FTOL_12669 [Fusarium torulosum]|uniref:DUF7726 domain-containing protein n=1 Tax=Fusarium torulosum TaxID=33205 RepID=A0AAE8ML24_9HYPO|nr:uncharacterized protein FTOL_12669 [Fusarium torulosum]